MRTISAILLLVAALLGAPSAASDKREVFTAGTTGEIVIDPEGRVIEVAVDRKALGEEVMDGFEKQIRQWRFAPIVVDGRPVQAKAHMTLQLVVIREAGVQGLRLGFEAVQFRDPAEYAAQGEVVRTLTPPRYPRQEMESFIGARVDLLVRLDAEGRVTHAAAEGVRLLGERVGNAPNMHARRFRQAAERAAAGWTIPGVEGGLAVVPVRFAPYSVGGERWVRTRVVAVETPAWVAIERGSKDVVALGDGGAQLSERWKLLTPLEG